ncbi:hypothetical protein [Allohahella sp. A8]|uniref:hypothetical protein n=1 Tax=Allohahella sp. A8 TaxID=3141461 RepID=UPI003A7FBA6A
MPYFLRGRSWDYCYAYIDPFTFMLVQEVALQPAQRINLYVDVMFLTGQLQMGNAGEGSSVPLGDVTRSQAFDASTNAAATASDWYDFDNDGQADRPVIGRMADIPDDATADLVFVEDGTGDLQGIYLSSNDKAEAPAESGTTPAPTPAPDLIRLLDEDRTRRLTENTGLLSSISRDDLQNTDVLVFRAATGQLVLERKGLGHAEVRAGELAVNEEGVAGYRLMLRGPADSAANVGAINRTSSFEEWATGYQLTEPFRKRESFHLQPGEWVEVVAINRSTGYMGTSRVQLKSVGDAGSTGLSVTLDPIVMRPPNLKVWAERMYNVEQGLQAGESRSGQIVSAEGASLLSDQSVRIFSEWLDHDGSPLPEGLSVGYGAQYGLTGRLAKVVASGVISSTSASDLAEFPIAPGRNTQLLQLSELYAQTEHYYIQVIGQAKNQECAQCASFDKSGADAGADAPLDTRPQYITPFLVPQYDEQKGWLAYREYRRLLKAGQEASAGGTPVDTAAPNRPLPSYAWTYRPEYQFSRFSLEVDAIKRVKITDPLTGSEEKDDILNAASPVITSSDKLIEVLYSLIGPEFGRIAPIDGGQDLVLALGEHETRVTMGEDQTLRIDNIEHLASLDPEDFLTMRLYLNQDAGNILWEYAFMYLSLGLAKEHDLVGDNIAYVRADDATIDLKASVLGYTGLTKAKQNDIPQQVLWRVIQGNATLQSQAVSLDEYGSATATVNLAPYSSNIVRVEASLLGDDSTRIQSFDMGVLAGKPKNIDLSQTGALYVGEVGSVEVKAIITDQFGNRVENGTGVFVQPHGHLTLKSQQGFTEDGVMLATLESAFVSGGFAVDVSSGGASASTNVTVAPLELSIQGLPDNLVAGVTYPLEVAVLGGGGNALEGLFIDLGADAGFVRTREHTTDGSGKLTFTYEAPSAAGIYNLAAKLDVTAPKIIPIEVVRPTTVQNAELAAPYIVAATATDQESTISDFADRAGTLTFAADNTLALTGLAAAAWDITTAEYHLINREPVLYASFLNPSWDQLHRYPARFEHIRRTSGPTHGVYALDFISSEEEALSQWSLAKPDLTAINQPGYHFWLKVRADGLLLSVADGSFNLSVNNGQLRAEIPAGRLSDSVSTSAVSVTVDGLEKETWYAVSVGVKNGELYLAVDDRHAVATLGDRTISYPTLSEGDPVITLGKGFQGQIAGLRVYDWSSTPLVEFDRTSGTLDATGKAEVTVRLAAGVAEKDLALPSVSVELIPSTGSAPVLNILNRNLVERFAGALQGVTGELSISAAKLLEQMPMTGIFPAPSQGAGGLIQRTTHIAGAQASQSSVLASIAWLDFGTNYPELKDQVRRLQTYFAQQSETELVGYAESYLQEATTQASQGRQFWVRTMATGLTVWGELIESRPDLAAAIAASMTNRRDYWSWIRILSLPANGWATENPPIPRPDMTCDKVTPDVNTGTVLAFSTTPCRASAAQMAAVLDTVFEVDPATYDQPRLLTLYMTQMLAALYRAPMESTRIFPSQDALLGQSGDFSVVPTAYAAGPLVYVPRALLVMLKQAIRAGTSGAPANFVALMQNGTTSRFTRDEILMAIGYLSTRLEGTDLCTDCKKLNGQVSETVSIHMASWFAGLGLAKKGQIEDGGLTRRSCMVANHAHGAAMELVATAGYHALFEFGESYGVGNAAQYEVLLADPRSDADRIEVGLKTSANGTVKDYAGSPWQRKPDLVLKGANDGQRIWVELKSWRFNESYLNKLKLANDGPTLSGSQFGQWNGKADGGGKSVTLNYTTAAHRQFFLDHAASGEALQTHFWKKLAPLKQSLRPNQHRTWFQIWKPGERSWRELTRKDGKYELESKLTTRNVATPWIKEGGLVTELSPQFNALRYFMTSAPGISNSAFKTSIGYSKSEHEKKYVNSQVEAKITSLPQQDIRPFNLATFFAIEVGAGKAEKIVGDLQRRFVGPEYAAVQKAIDDGTFSEEAIAELRENITDQILGILGPWQYLAVDIWGLSWIENGIGDILLGDEAEALREAVAQQDLSSSPFDFEVACETP